MFPLLKPTTIHSLSVSNYVYDVLVVVVVYIYISVQLQKSPSLPLSLIFGFAVTKTTLKTHSQSHKHTHTHHCQPGLPLQVTTFTSSPTFPSLKFSFFLFFWCVWVQVHYLWLFACIFHLTSFSDHWPHANVQTRP